MSELAHVTPTYGLGSNGLDVRLVHPSKGAQYSQNLYSWLLKGNSHQAWTSRVYADKTGDLWIGMQDRDDMIGSRLLDVLCGGSKADRACWVNLGPFFEITDFWRRYVRDGRCAIDLQHEKIFVGDQARWLVSGDTRSCVWCGKASQLLSRWTEVVEHQEWRPEPAPGPASGQVNTAPVAPI